MYYKFLGALITLFGIILLVTGYSFFCSGWVIRKAGVYRILEMLGERGHVALYWVLHFLDL